MRLRCTLGSYLLLVVAFASPTRAELIGVEFDFSDGGVFVIDETGSGATFVGPSGVAGLNSLAVDSGGGLYSAARSDSEVQVTDDLVTIDPLTGQGTVVASLTGITAPNIRALAFSPDDELFGIHFEPATQTEPSTNTLVRIDPGDGQVTIVALLAIAGIQGLDFAPDGTLYGWGTYWGLVTIDTGDGSYTDIGQFAGGSPIMQTLEFAADGTLQGAGTRLWSVDVSTGSFTQVGTGTLPDIRGIARVSLPAPVPALGGWGTLLLCAALAGTAALACRART